MGRFIQILTVVMMLSVIFLNTVAYSFDCSHKDFTEKSQGPWNDEPVKDVINKGIQFILLCQLTDGSFPPASSSGVTNVINKESKKWHNAKLRTILLDKSDDIKMEIESKQGTVGNTALALYALLRCGVDIKHKAIQKGLGYLTAHDTYGVYSLGVRSNLWRTVIERSNKMDKKKYFKYLKHDAVRLIYSLQDTGSWNYTIWEDYGVQNSTSQYGILGVWAYQMHGGEVPEQFWKRAMKFWIAGQNRDGGWPYTYCSPERARHLIGCLL